MARLSLLLLSAAVAAAVSANDPFILQVVPKEETSTDHLLNAERHFSLFKTKFGKTYATAEEHNYRLTVFKSNLRRAKRHQLLDSTAEHGVTKFSGLTASEFCERYLGLKSGFSFPSDANKVLILPTGDIPEEFD